MSITGEIVIAKKMGRPPVPYLDEYPNLLIQHMAAGYSFESFGAHANCCKETLYSWLQKYPDFSDAKKEGEAKCRHWWEEKGNEAMNGLIPGFIASIYIFNMKNRFGWRDVIDANIKSEHKQLNVNINVDVKAEELTTKIVGLLDEPKEVVQIRKVKPTRIKSST